MRRFPTFQAFWPYYLQEHARAGTRALHYAGTTGVVILALLSLAVPGWALLMAVPVAGYGFAWLAHVFVEHNRPATFRYPFWSLGGDFLMWYFFLRGRIAGELTRAGVRRDGTIDPALRL